MKKLTTKTLARELAFPNGRLAPESDGLVSVYSRLMDAKKWNAEREAGALMKFLEKARDLGYITFVEV